MLPLRERAASNQSRERISLLPSDPNLSEARPRLRRSLHLALFVTSIAWVVAATQLAARAARGFSIRFQLGDEFLLIEAAFLLFLLGAGFAMLQSIMARNTPLRETLGLPERRTARSEWATGAAIGWGTIVLAVLPMALIGTLSVRFWTEPRSFWLVVVNLAAIAGLALASEMAFRGYPYQRLIEAIGPSWATVVMALLFAAIGGFNQNGSRSATVITVLLGALLCSAWLRTHGLWLGWGLRFAWMASLGILFGFPVNGLDNVSSLVQTRAIGPEWLTGGDFGPEGTIWMVLLLIGAIAVLIRTTREWAWEYTHKPIVPGGYPMDGAPPAAHTAMEKAGQGTKAPILVQILPSTSQTRSVNDDLP
jgi:membrane protease YdiL (CAAX protease family)